MKTRVINIVETRDKWLWRERGRYYKSAAGAQRAIKRDAREIAPVIQVITWHTSTAIGKAIVRAITATHDTIKEVDDERKA